MDYDQDYDQEKEEDTSCPQPMLAECAAHYHAGTFAEAEVALRAALEQAPDDPTLLVELGKVLTILRGHEEGLAVLMQAKALVPDAPVIDMAIAWAYFMGDDYDRAHETVVELLRNSSGWPGREEAITCLQFLERDYDAVIRGLKGVRVERLWKVSPNLVNMLAVSLFHRRRFEEALQLATRMADWCPWSADSHHLGGLCLARLGRTSEALEAFERAVTLKPLYREAWGGAFGTCLRAGRLPTAWSYLRRGVTALTRDATGSATGSFVVKNQ